MLDSFVKLLSRWIPVAILVVTVFNLFTSYNVDNNAAVSANIVALVGWMYIVLNEFTGKKIVG
jgi:branched-subunit amino acid transport protein AzlD